MGKLCKECGYQTVFDKKEICPFCGAALEPGEVHMDEKRGHIKKQRISLGQLKLPLFMVSIILVVLIYILLHPEKVGYQMKEFVGAFQSVLDSITETQINDTSGMENEYKISKDPYGNEILVDFEIPGVVTQPEYILSESARDLWTVSTGENGLNLRSGPGTEYEIIGFLEEGTNVTRWGYNDLDRQNWIVLEYNGQYGWGCTDYMTQGN